MSRPFFSWLRFFGPVRTPVVARRAVRTRPGCEALEDRFAPATLTVNTNSDVTDHTGNSAFTLREAIAVVNANSTAGLTVSELAQIDTSTTALGTDDTIVFSFAGGQNVITLTEASGGELNVSAKVVITGPGASNATINGSGSSRIFNFTASAPEYTLSGLTFQGGFATFSGGAIRTTGFLTVTDCDFVNNIASENGGAIHSTKRLIVTGSTFENNLGQNGGAINVNDGNNAITNSTFVNNNATRNGGAINVNNVAGTLTVLNSTIVLNRADFDDTSAAETGGGISQFATNTAVTLQNTIVAGNLHGSGAGATNDDLSHTMNAASSFNIIGHAATSGGLSHGTNNNIVGNAGSGTLALSSILVPVLFNNGGQTGTLALVAGSPARDAGSNGNAAGVNFDQRGLPRIANTTVDIGAVETEATPPTVASIDDGDADNTASVNATLTYTISFTKDIAESTFTNTNLNNAGTATITIGAVSETAPGLFTFQVTPTTPGTIVLRIRANAAITDVAGNLLAVPVQDDTTVTALENTPPTVTSFNDNDADDTVIVNQQLTYTVTFSEDIDENFIIPADFVNNGTATITVGTLTETSPGVFSVPVTPTTPGTIILRIPNGVQIRDVAGNGLTVPVQDDTTVTVNSAVPPPNFTGALIVNTTSDVDDNIFTANNLSLREAIRIANFRTGTDPITFATSLNGQTITLAGTRLVVTDSVTITGPGSHLLTIDGNDASQLFYIDGSASSIDVTIQQMTLTGGAALGGGVVTDGFDNGLSGGAINNNRARLTLRRLVIANNSAPDATPVGSGVEAGGGGALINWFGGSTITIIETTLSQNSSGRGGGAIYNWTDSTLIIANSTLSGNAARNHGGAIRGAHSAAITITNSTISGNNAGLKGGGVMVEDLPLTITNSTITLNGADSDNDNSTVQTGGGLYIDTGSVAKLFNTIVAGNFVNASVITDPNIASDDINGINVDASSSNNLISDYIANGGLVNGVNRNIVGNGSGSFISITTILDIGLIPGPSFQLDASQGLRDNGGPTKTHALVQNSRAIGAASTSVTGYSAYDQRDAARDSDPSIGPDIGAYETHHPLVPVGVPDTFAEIFQPKPSPDANTAYVKGLYQSTLLREAEAEGLAFWVGRLVAGDSKSSVANGFVNSKENRENQVKFYYSYFLGREADPSELPAHVNALVKGTVDEGDVMNGFILSFEFSQSNNNTQFVDLMYYALLGRQRDEDGFQASFQALEQNLASRADIVNTFLRSTEGIGRVLAGFYSSYLKRDITPTERANLVSFVAGGATFGTAAISILATDEFFIAAGNNR